MYTMDDLFDKRSVIGKKLELLLSEKGSTKADLCKKSGVSRPTLDKLLAGTLTNKTNYEKHMAKVLGYFEITPSMLLGNTEIQHNTTRKLRNMMKISSEQIAQNTSISIKRLEEIEAGEAATQAELREIAMCLSVSVNCLLEKKIFEPQVAVPDMFLQISRQNELVKYCGFWGHIGIKLRNQKDYIWFPIVSSTRHLVHRVMELDRMVIPCMNNKVLFLNMKNVEEIIFSDFDCDQPDFVNWSPDVDCGEIPLVVYESLEDFFYDENENALSINMRKVMQEIVEENGWSEDDVYDVLHLTEIYYADGNVRPITIDFDGSEDISEEIEMVYLYEETEFSSNVLMCEEYSGNEILINMNNVSMMVLPLLDVENAILERCEAEKENE